MNNITRMGKDNNNINNEHKEVQLQRLTTFEGLEIGTKVTEVFIGGFRTYEFMGYDPRLPDHNMKYDYGYFLESFGRTRCPRWHKSSLKSCNIYIGYDTIFIKTVEYHLLQKRLLDVRKEIPVEMYYCQTDEDQKLTLDEIKKIQFHSDVTLGETLASVPADGLSIEEAFELYMNSMFWYDADRFFREIEGSGLEEFTDQGWVEADSCLQEKESGK